MMFYRLSILCLIFTVSLTAKSSPRIIESGDTVTLQNDQVRLEFDLSTGSYNIYKQSDSRAALSNAKLKLNAWSSDQAGMDRTWSKRQISDALGEGLALEISLNPKAAPELLFTFVLYEGADFFSATAGMHNTTEEPIRITDIHIVADAALYSDFDVSKDFAMIDGFNGGEPLEYGERSYSPLTRANALKSRNNIFLTFTENGERHQLTMGGLSYHDFEKFAHIAQSRRTELSAGADGKNSLLCYLNLPSERSDQSDQGERIALTKGETLQTWENHEFRCLEMATAVKEPNNILIEAQGLKPDQPYTLGFSWWQGHRYGDHEDLYQSVFVEYKQDGETIRLPLLEDRRLPRFDRVRKEDVEQVELPLPADAIKAGALRIVIEKAAQALQDESEAVYLSEVWLRDGNHAPLLPIELTPVSESPRPRLEHKAQLFASDPVGKRVHPNQRYIAEDQFYIDVTGDDPFTALEGYADKVRKAQGIDLSMYDFPTVCLWYAADKRYGGVEGGSADNTSVGAVEEAKVIKASGFQKYSRVAVRLVPDSYMPDNQQGWWDDEHWQREDTDRDTTENGRYIEPYETTEKWGTAVTELGSVPLTYFQTAYRSEDYAAQFPGHMLFNKRYAWKGEPVDTDSEIFTTWEKTWTRNGRIVWGYDFTDPDFLDHMEEVYTNLKKGGIKGLMFDYPASGWAKDGGMEDKDSTTAAAYRTIFRLPHNILGPESYVHERNMERGTDLTLGVVASMRTENDTDSMDAATVTRCGLRWYKNRVLVNFDTDSKNLLELEENRDHVRAVLTMCYVTTGRLLLANSFGQYSADMLWDLSRTFPYHTAPQSARPVDAFVSEVPMVYDFEVTPDWHQVTFYNPDMEQPKRIGIDIAGAQVDGSLGLDAEKEYFFYDFWNNHFIGKFKGDTRLEQELRPGEARMISARACQHRPQVLSSDRHIMQGYLDLKDVSWNEDDLVLSGTSQIVAEDPYRIILASNGYAPLTLQTTNQSTQTKFKELGDGLIELTLESPENQSIEWSVCFERK